MTNNNFYDQYSSVCKTIVNPVRQRIIEIIGDSTLNVTKIQEKLNISMSNLSNHLSALYKVGVLSRKKEGNYVYYFLTEPKIIEVLERMKDIIVSIVQKKNSEIIKGKHP
jgi:ArsR family transcriptional regulator